MYSVVTSVNRQYFSSSLARCQYFARDTFLFYHQLVPLYVQDLTRCPYMCYYNNITRACVSDAGIVSLMRYPCFSSRMSTERIDTMPRMKNNQAYEQHEQGILSAHEEDLQHAQWEHDRDYNPLSHDALHCRFCSTDKKILQASAIQTAILQRLLTKYQEAEGTPHGTPFVFTQLTPTQNTTYTSQAAPMGVVRSMLITGTGNVTVKMSEPHNAIAGGMVIAVVACGNGNSIPVPHRFVIPQGATFSLATDSASAPLVSLSVWVEPVNASGQEMFQLRK